MKVGDRSSSCLSRLLFLVTVGAAITAATSPGFSRTGLTGRIRSGPPLPPCSHIGDSTNSIAARAYMADIVFIGKARSRNVAREIGGTYGVTFVVQDVCKDTSVKPLSIKKQIRFQFREKRGRQQQQQHQQEQQQQRSQQQKQLQQQSHNWCRQSYNYTRRPGDLVRTNIKRGGKYIVFVMGVGPLNYTLLGEPVFRSHKNVRAVKDALCKNCFRAANVTGLKDTNIKQNKKLRLVCRSKGNPLPAITWYKDGQPINASRHSKIQFKKKRSFLIIRRVTKEDSGRYECRGMTVTGAQISSWATVTVESLTTDSSNGNINVTNIFQGKPCPIDHFCFNGGNCTYYESVGELGCQCAEGFKGQRCESKDVNNRSSMYRRMSYFCKLGISSSYYC